MRDKKTYLVVDKLGNILDIYAPCGYVGMAHYRVGLNKNISCFMKAVTCLQFINKLKLVLRTNQPKQFNFKMHYGDMNANREITIFPGAEPDTVRCLLKSLESVKKAGSGEI